MITLSRRIDRDYGAGRITYWDVVSDGHVIGIAGHHHVPFGGWTFMPSNRGEIENYSSRAKLMSALQSSSLAA